MKKSLPMGSGNRVLLSAGLCGRFSGPILLFAQWCALTNTGTTTFTDTNAIGSGPFFYRVGVQP